MEINTPLSVIEQFSAWYDDNWNKVTARDIRDKLRSLQMICCACGTEIGPFRAAVKTDDISCRTYHERCATKQALAQVPYADLAAKYDHVKQMYSDCLAQRDRAVKEMELWEKTSLENTHEFCRSEMRKCQAAYNEAYLLLREFSDSNDLMHAPLIAMLRIKVREFLDKRQ